MRNMHQTGMFTAPVAEVSSSRRPGILQAIVLLMTSGFAVMVTAVIGPNLPAMQAHFHDSPNADILVPLTMSAPSLTLALFGIVAGELADRWGRKQLMVWAALLYAIVGTMPLYLSSLVTILASRFALGVFEAVLITISSIMIADYYEGRQRERMIMLQTVVTSVSAIALSIVGSTLGVFGWRMPYALYGASLVFSVLIAIVLWEPVTRATMPVAQRVAEIRTFNVGPLLGRCVLAFVLGIAFLTFGAHLGYLLASVGIHDASQVALAFALYSTGTLLGTLLLGGLMALGVSLPYVLGFATVGAGAVLSSAPFANGLVPLTLTGFLYGLTMGILLPALTTWNLRELPLSRRGFGTGAMMSSLFLGMFIGPVLPVVLERAVDGSRVFAMAIEGYALLALGVAGSVLVGTLRALRGRSRRSVVGR